MSWDELKEIRYKVETTLVLDFTEEKLSIFGCKSDIFVNKQEELCFVCNLLTTSGFDREFHAFEVEFDGDMLCIAPESLISLFLVILVQKSDAMYATVKHIL